MQNAPSLINNQLNTNHNINPNINPNPNINNNNFSSNEIIFILFLILEHRYKINKIKLLFNLFIKIKK